MADNRTELEIAVTGNAEVQLKKISDAAERLERKGGGAAEGFGHVWETALGVFTGEGALEGLKKIGEVAAEVAKDLIFEGENIRQIGTQFELLSKNAGIAGEALKGGLLNAADGLIDDTDLIKIANQALVEMGATAAKLPPVMELARKATAVFGGDLAKNFEAIEHAIATGQTRALKNIGIIVDSDKAYRDFATSLGTTADKLSDAGKQNAILNAVLEQNRTQFKDVDLNAKEATDTFQRLKVTLAQVGETATLAFERLAGEKVRSILGFTSDAAKSLSTSLTATFGEGAEKAKANVEVLEGKITSLKVAIIDGEQAANKHRDAYEKWRAGGNLDGLRAELAKYEAQLATEQKVLDTVNEAQEKNTASNNKGKQSFIDLTVERKKAADEGEAVAKRLAGEDPALKYLNEVAALQAANEQKRSLAIDYNTALAALDAEHEKRLTESRAKEIEDLVARNDALKTIDAQKNADEIAANQTKINYIAAQEKSTSTAALKAKADQVKREKELDSQRLSNLQGTFGFISSLMQSNTEELFRVGQAAAIATATVDGIMAVQKALASAPPPFNFVLAGLVGAATAVNVAKIASAPPPKFKDGGIVPGFSTSGDKVPVLANSGEMYLNNFQQRRLLSIASGQEGVGGGNIAGLLASIEAKLSRLQPNFAISLDGREIFNSMRSQLQAGRSFA